MVRAFRCDLHVHTCLSPCAELDMYPTALVKKAIEKELDVIAVCDHNASENVPYVIRAALSRGLKALPGMEVTSREEVHLLAIFDMMPSLQKLQEIIDANLKGKNSEDRFGYQVVVNELDEVMGFNEKLLIGATDLSLDDLVGKIHDLGGIAVASHIDRGSFSVISQLGFIDPEIQFDALEITGVYGYEDVRRKYPELGDYTFIQSSDAHRILEIGRKCTEIYMEEPKISELKMAFAGRCGRYVVS